ncbi:hypothetical protein OG689_21080 [Kitasatospora sp. NBC_00240]|uniref:hypothetical protein n=1 Tax=Kitasatospora sp. NBC_00240 TaxID=2903567 RepID=UPI002257C625|nr:hypothetical protein [Kitasatospora sp. NBC_00240]MCX5211753.1 hypothetical protein [Kitasatospora sp. NBC_00240]
MTPPTSSPHPAGPHPSIDELADLAEELIEDPGTADSLREHLTGCPECRETLAALAEVSDLLGAVETPPMPDDVARRLDAALAAEAAGKGVDAGATRPPGHSAPSASAPAHQTPAHPRQEPRPLPTAPPAGPGRNRRRARRRVLLGTAFALAAVTLGALLLRTPAPDQAADTAAGAAAASTAAPSFDVPSPGSPSFGGGQRPGSEAPQEQPAIKGGASVYREETLAAQARQLVRAARPAARPADGTDLSTHTAPPCAPSGTGSLLATDHGTFEGVPVEVLVYADPGNPDQLDVYLVASDCGTAPATVLLHRTVPAH